MTDQPNDETQRQIETIRHFSRFYTRKFGLLSRKLLGSNYGLTEGRIIFELANSDPEDLTANRLASSLGVDPGYLSRILKTFRERGLVTRTPSEADSRVRLLALTDKGRALAREFADKSNADVAGMISHLNGGDRDRLVGALTDAETLLGGKTEGAVILREHRPGDMGWVTQLHGEVYSREYGWTGNFEDLTARICADFLDNYDPARERCWIAERNGQRLGSVFLVKEDAETARLRLLILDPAARGLGLGRQLVDECLHFAHAAGYKRVTLWTNSVLTAARRIYQAAGFRLVSEKKHRDFGPELTGQNWLLDL